MTIAIWIATCLLTVIIMAVFLTAIIFDSDNDDEEPY